MGNCIGKIYPFDDCDSCQEHCCDICSKKLLMMGSALSKYEKRLDDEEAAREDADTKLQENLDAEINRATEAEAQLDAKIDKEIQDRINDVNDEENRAIQAEARLRNDLNDEIDRATTKENELDAAINKEIADREAAIAELEKTTSDNLEQAKQELQTNIDNEVTRAKAAEQTLQSNIDKEVQDRIADVNAEETRATEAEKVLQSNIDAEETRATEAEQLLTTNLNSEIARAKAAEEKLATDLNTEIQNRTNADSTLQSNIDDEASRAKSAEQALRNDLNAETSNRQLADNTLQTNIDNEVVRAKAAEKVLTDNLASEVERATNKENELNIKIDTETNRAKEAESTLQTNINNEQNARIEADNDLSQRIENLEGKTTRLFYGNGTLSSPTATEIQSFIDGLEVDPPYAPPYSGIAIVVYLTDEKTYHIWHYYTNLATWKDDGIDTVTTFTNTTKGIIQGSTNEGYISSDNGLGKVNGFSELKEQVGNNYDALNTKIEEETTRATAVEESLRNDLNTEVSRAKAAEEKLTTDLTAEVGRATAKENELDAAITKEIQDRTSADSTLQNNITAEKTRAEAAEQELDEKITAETTRATEAEETLQANIDAEETRATQAETTLTTNLNKEIQDRTNADTTLKTNIENGTIVANKATNDSDGNPINTTYVKVEGFKTNYLDSNNVMYKDDVQAVDSDLSEDKVLNGLNINGEIYNIARVGQNRYQHINILSFTNIPDTYTNWRTSISGNMNEPEDSLVFAGSFSNIPENINIYQSVIFDPVLTMGDNCGEIERSLLIGNITSGCNFTYNGGSSSSNRIEESIILSPAFRAEIDRTIPTAGNIFHSVYIALDQYQSERQDNLIPVKTLWSSIVIGIPSWREEYEEGYNYRYAVLIGSDSYTLGNNTVTIGYLTKTYKSFDIAIGCGTSTSNETGSMNNLAIGTYINFVGQCIQCIALGDNTKVLASRNHIYFDSIYNDRTLVISDLSHILFRNDDITDTTTSINDFPNKKTLQDYFDAKQDTLTAGTGISITDNTISCTVTSPVTATDVVIDLQ